MDQSPLELEQIDAGAKFLNELQRHFPVQIAFWVRESDENEWFLYVASEEISDDNRHENYGRVVEAAYGISDPHFDMFRVKLISAADPLASAALALRRRYPGRVPMRFDGRRFGGLPVDGVYIYPSPIRVPA
jgi:hypothetical protein